MPRSIANVTLLAMLVMLLRAVAYIHLGVTLEPEEILGYPVGFGVLGLVYKLVPTSSQKWLEGRAMVVLSSAWVTRIAFSALLMATALSLLVSTIHIDWTGDHSISATINAERWSLDPSYRQGPKSHAREFTLTLKPVTVEVAGFKEEVWALPLRPAFVSIPFYATASQRGELWEIEHELDLALLQQDPRQYVRRAEDGIAKLASTRDSAGDAGLQRLERVAEILRATLIDTSLSETKGRLLESYERKYPQDSWVPVLHGLSTLAEPTAQTLTALEAEPPTGAMPRAGSVAFVRGIAWLRLGNRERADGESAAASDMGSVSPFARAAAEFDRARRDAELHGAAYKTVALPSALVFSGIAHFYRRDFEAALTDLHRVLDLQDATEPVKARAANGIGYISFLKGDLALAKTMLGRALTLYREMSIPRINQGYLLLASEQWGQARAHFENLLRDSSGELAPRDVLLAKLGLAHALDESTEGTDVQLAAALQHEVLRKLRVNDFDYLQDTRERRAHVLAAIGRRVYLFNRDYYALEPIASIALSQACQQLCAARDDPTSLAGLQDLRDELRWLISTLNDATRNIPIMQSSRPGFRRFSEAFSPMGCACAADTNTSHNTTEPGHIRANDR